MVVFLLGRLRVLTEEGVQLCGVALDLGPEPLELQVLASSILIACAANRELFRFLVLFLARRTFFLHRFPSRIEGTGFFILLSLPLLAFAFERSCPRRLLLISVSCA